MRYVWITALFLAWLFGLYCLHAGIYTWWGIVLIVIALVVSVTGWVYIILGKEGEK